MRPIRVPAIAAAFVAVPLITALSVGASPAAAATVDPCAGWTVTNLVSGLGRVENLVPDGVGMLLSSIERNQLERLLPDGTIEVAFADVPVPGGLQIRDGILFVNTGNSATSGVAGIADGTIERIDLATGDRSTYATGLVMPNGLVFDHDGRAFVSRDLGADAAMSMIPADAPRDPVRWAEIRDTNGMAVDRAGEWLYVATTFDPLAPISRVRLDDPTVIENVANLTSVGIPVAKGLDDLVMDGADVIYVTANGSGELLRLDPATGDACVILSGIGNPTAVKFGDGVAFPANRLYVSSWDGIIRELTPPAGAEPTLFPPTDGAPDASPSPTDDGTGGATDGATGDATGEGGGSLPVSGGGLAGLAVGLLALGAAVRVRR